jgi:serine/threonine-protein kinase
MEEKSPALSSDPALVESRFLPGAMVAGRYRIVGILGKGGMGEVYRADDLRLGQPVALKFLPEAFGRDPGKMARLRDEVRISRQVSHPNVCRVYDIGEAEGHTFLTMEYVDGEDLASLLRRIGRLPQDKAIEMARQLCAGLAAAHDRGVLHRDLKPANVMIDGRGRLRITDFGLARPAEAIQGAEALAGTPAYMSPEQLAGTEVTAKSDLYALGLVLYEMFTGKAAFAPETTARTHAELARRREDATPARPTSVTPDLDPVVERVILRCLEKDPQQRPASALSVAAALPGGDPLAAALAAGETPSPEMVAAAGESGVLRPLVGWIGLMATVAGIILFLLLSDRYSLLRRAPFEKSPEVLADRARDLILRLGYTDPPADYAYGPGHLLSYLRYIEAHDPSAGRWDRLATGRPPALFFWYRQSPRPLKPFSHDGQVDFEDPPPTLSGMMIVFLDTRGLLWWLEAVPPQIETGQGPWPEPRWADLFAEAGLDLAGFRAVAPEWNPPGSADRRAAWEGHYTGQVDPPIRVEAASFHGRPIYFQIVGPWTNPNRMTPIQVVTATGRLSESIQVVLILMALVGGAMVARHNLRLGRGDRRGASRVALFVFSCRMLAWLVQAHHVPALADEWSGLVVPALGVALYLAGLTWIIYIALEPYVRREWPDTLISWSRMLAGRFRDPLVGHDILFGCLFGVLVCLVHRLRGVVPAWVRLPPSRPFVPDIDALMGMGRTAVHIIRTQQEAVISGLGLLFLLLLFRSLFRGKWAAAGGVFLVLTVVGTLEFWEGRRVLDPLLGALTAILITFVLVRFGLFALIVGTFVTKLLLSFPVTLNLSAWYAPFSTLALVTVTALVVYGFLVSGAAGASRLAGMGFSDRSARLS